MIRMLSLMVAVWCVSGSVAHAAQALVRHALVLGYNGSQDADRQPLRYADDDAASTHQLLRDAGVHSTLLMLTDEETDELHPDLSWRAPTVEELAQAVAKIAADVAAAKQSGADVDFIFFYSGHGDVDAGEGYVTLANGRLTRSQLHALLTAVGATRNHVVIDACRSYFLVFDRGPGGERTPYFGAPPEAFLPSQLANTGFVLSTASDRESHEWERFRSGIFSHEIRSALRGGADVNQDGTISYAELGAFVEKANAKVSSRFRPEVLVRAPRNDLSGAFLTWHSGASLQLAPANWGHVYLESSRGERLLDVHPLPFQSLTVRVPDDRPLFVRRHDQSAEYVVETAEQTTVDPAAGRAPSVVARGAINLAFEGLFSSPITTYDVELFTSATHSEAHIRVVAEEDVPVAAPSPVIRRSAWSLGAVGAGVLTAAFGTWLRARESEGELRGVCGSDRVCSGDDDWRGLQDTARRQARWSHALVAVGGVGVAGALALRFWPRVRPSLNFAGDLNCDARSCAVQTSLRW